jgi:hypothetical protein
MGVLCLTLLNKVEKISVWHVVGCIGWRIVLILFKWPPPTLILVNLAPIARRMAMMQTIALSFIQSYRKVNPRQEMWGSPQVLVRATTQKVRPIKGQQPSELQTNPMPWKHNLHIWRR